MQYEFYPKRTLLVVIVLIFLSPLSSKVFSQQLDDSWTVTVNGQTVNVSPDGTFRISNIATPDNFGPGGPGTRPDFLGDDFVRVVGRRTVNGQTQYAFGTPFQIRQGETFGTFPLTITNTPPPLPESLSLTAPTNLVEVGQTLQLTTTGTLQDGSQVDLTQRAEWTVYRTSNPRILTVSENGLVTGVAAGSGFVTAVNDGATAVKRIVVTQAIRTTTVEGRVRDENGNNVSGATVSTQFEDSSTTDANGAFSFEVDVPSENQSIIVNAVKTNGQTLRGSSGAVSPVPDGITDVGIIIVRPGLHSGSIRLLIVAADNAPPVNEFLATGLFDTVDQITNRTPTLAELSQYEVVMNYTNFVPQNATVLGDRLADYVDQGGCVVLCTYSFSNPWAVRGRITTSGYSPLIDGGQNGSPSGQLIPTVTDDPIFQGIDLNSLVYFQNFNFARPALDTGATLLATDGNGVNMIARNIAGSVYGVNLFPAGGNFGGNNTVLYQLIARICTFP